MANTKQFSFDDLTIDKFKNIDLSTLSELSEEEQSVKGKAIIAAAASLSYLVGFVDETNTVFDFPFNNDGLQWVERYLNTIVKPSIAGWDEKSESGLGVKRVKLPSGLKSSNPQAIQEIDALFFIAHLVATQCLAQEHDYCWNKDLRGATKRGDKENQMSTERKVRKFVRFGVEDNLQHFSITLKHAARNTAMVNKALEVLREDGITFPAGSIRQQWTSPSGDLDKLVILDQHTNKALRVIKFVIQNSN